MHCPLGLSAQGDGLQIEILKKCRDQSVRWNNHVVEHSTQNRCVVKPASYFMET